MHDESFVCTFRFVHVCLCTVVGYIRWSDTVTLIVGNDLDLRVYVKKEKEGIYIIMISYICTANFCF